MLPCWVSGVGSCCMRGSVCGLRCWQRGMVSKGGKLKDGGLEKAIVDGMR